MKQAVILADTVTGNTTNTPTPLLQVCGRPFIAYQIENLRRHGIKNILLVVGHYKESYLKYFEKSPTSGLQIELVADIPSAGTANALRHAQDLLDERFFLLNGNSYFDFNLLDLTTDRRNIARIALHRFQWASQYEKASLEGDEIVQFGDRSSNGEELINAGVYWLDRKILNEMDEKSICIETDIFPKLAKDGRLGGSIYNGAFIDIGKPDDLKRAQKLIPEWRRRPAAFLDRDGIINHDTGYVWQQKNYKWIEGSNRAIKRLNDLGYYVFVVTNQAGVARGLYSAADVERLHSYVNETLRQSGAHVDAFYYCPHHPDFGNEQYRQHCDCRKPRPGMLVRAMNEWPIDLSQSFMIGDRDSDMDAAEAAGVPLKRLFLGGDIEAAMAEIAPPFARPS